MDKSLRIEKKTLARLERCYALAKFTYKDERKYLVASEKRFPCLLLGKDGNVEDTVWEQPGGVMTLEPLNDGSMTFLATHEFYSPNDSANARIIAARPIKSPKTQSAAAQASGPDSGDRETSGQTLSAKTPGGWEVRTLSGLPFVHRFGILRRGGRRFIIACTLKSAHAFKNDWTCPGRIWVGELKDGADGWPAIPELKPLESGLLKNHGFFKCRNDYALVGAENGIYKVIPPDISVKDGAGWQCEKIYDLPASDMAEGDFDGDGIREMMVFSPFHGDELFVLKPRSDGGFREVYRHDGALPFLHAIAVGKLDGRDVAFIGYREADMALFMLSCDENGCYHETVIDTGTGTANVLCDEADGCLRLLAANRGIDEVAMYTLRSQNL